MFWVLFGLCILLALAASLLFFENRRLGFLLKGLRIQILDLNRKRTDFVANVSHELKTPLTSIQGFAETLKNGAINDPTKAQSFLEKILDSTERLDRLIHDILELSRLEATDQHLSIEKIDVDEFLKSIREMFIIKLEQKNQSLLLDNEIKKIEADRHLLEQAFSNLVSNANRYCPEGAVIEIVGREQNHSFVFDVIDNGPGISADDLPRIFERFYRADKSRNRAFGGTGLGLAIVKHIVQSHGGKVAAELNQPAGMKFRMLFPGLR